MKSVLYHIGDHTWRIYFFSDRFLAVEIDSDGEWQIEIFHYKKDRKIVLLNEVLDEIQSQVEENDCITESLE